MSEFLRGRLKVRMRSLGTCIGSYGPVDYCKAKGVILTELLVVLYADHVRFHPRHPYMGSLYRASTDALITAMQLSCFIACLYNPTYISLLCCGVSMIHYILRMLTLANVHTYMDLKGIARCMSTNHSCMLIHRTLPQTNSSHRGAGLTNSNTWRTPLLTNPGTP